MSRRITLSDDDIELIGAALWELHKSSIINPSAYPQQALASRQRIKQIAARMDYNRDSRGIIERKKPRSNQPPDAKQAKEEQ